MRVLLLLASTLIAAAQSKTLLVLPQCSQANMIPLTVVVSVGTIPFPILKCALLDANSFSVDFSTNPLTLRARTASVTLPVNVDRDPIVGVIDGVNAVFTLSAAPNPPESLLLPRNGLVLGPNDYSLSGATITFAPGAIPQIDDKIGPARYRK